MKNSLQQRNNGNALSELPSLFNDPFLRNWFSWSTDNETNNSIPATNIQESEEHFKISVAAPGMKKDDFKIQLENNRLVITGEKKNEVEHKESAYLRKEFSYQSFTRTFTLAERQVQPDKVQASYADGILEITIPKSQEAINQKPRIIPIG